MYNISKFKIFISVLLTLIATIIILPNFRDMSHYESLPQDKLVLGLDLRGGAHLLLDVDFDTYLKDQMELVSDAIRKELRHNKIGYKNFFIKSDANHGAIMTFTLRSEQNDQAQIRKLINDSIRGASIDITGDKVTIAYHQGRLEELQEQVIDQSIEIIRMRVDSTGTKEPMIQRQGKKHILLQVPGEEDPGYLKNLLGQTAKMTFHIVDESATTSSHDNSVMLLPLKDKEGTEEANIMLPVKKKALLSGDMLVDARANFYNAAPVVEFEFNAVGSKIFAEVTKENHHKRLAIVLDNEVLSAPTINDPILGGKGHITGNFSVEAANELALLLRAGALPAPLNIVEERSIGPNLGLDSIEAGKKAGILGFVAVVIFMIWSYGILGIFANIALTLAMLYIFAMLTMFQATLTLPGIAGIILTIGMAVDANVLIYERIREELHKGNSNLHSIRQGFNSAFATIADSNITTLIAAFLLYIFGTGAIKGFAVALSIGLVASMFTAIIVTKLLIDSWYKLFSPKNLGL